ncbi:hypothetical protein Q4610_15485 [Sphingobium sp. HBC34]|uniref:Tetracyclin repressor-like C-terminal domain-containing protein n=1 Tax=Sphingobium cyanobacteriorum TaxID=3063954 RepID=A0ABT8ZPK6_9SPHN|nr:hypothetical protein [Sphingobium sp. HBC34]MDO7836450.1 hypothetical protein [Sphingobium sp. HBC34]
MGAAQGGRQTSLTQLLMDDPDYFGPAIATEFSRPVGEVQRRILEESRRAGVFRPIDPIIFYVQVVGACDQLFTGRYQLEHVFNAKKWTKNASAVLSSTSSKLCSTASSSSRCRPGTWD